jgi:hypothetical protein
MDIEFQFAGPGEALAGTINQAMIDIVSEARAHPESVRKMPALVPA